MKFPDRSTVERVRAEYPPGTRIILRHMSDPQAPPVGTCGEITGVDDLADLLVKWDNGSSLKVILSEDIVEKVE